MNRTAFAAAAGIGRTTAWRWENSDQRPENIEVVARVAEVLGLDLDEALAAAGLRPAAEPPSVPTRQERPIEDDLRILNDRLTDPNVSAEEKHLIRAHVAYLIELAKRSADQPTSHA